MTFPASSSALPEVMPGPVALEPAAKIRSGVHRIPSPDFRYVWLEPAPRPSGRSTLAVGSSTVIAIVGALGLTASHDAGIATVLAVAAGQLAGAFALGGALAWAARARDRGVPMAVVPWGVVVDPERSARALRWPALSRVDVEVRADMRGGTPVILSSEVTVATERETFRGRAPGAVGLELLSVHLSAWTDEAARPVARDLDGSEPAGDGATEPLFAELFRCAAELCSSGPGAVRLGLPPGGYRLVSSRNAGPETARALAEVLDAPTRGLCADPRPLAAILAGFLGARGALPSLLGLTCAPHPVTAAAARAAAMKLGAPPNRTGAIDELDPFLPTEDLAMLVAWANDRGRSFVADPRAMLLVPSG